MAVTIARWLCSHDDPEVRASLALFEAYARREYYDGRTGAVYDTIGMDPKFKRLYNAPSFSRLWVELFNLTHDPKYLDDLEKTILGYYEADGPFTGEKFYPNGTDFSMDVALLEREGRDASRIRAHLERHVANILANGLHYPAHEVRYEQTIVSPAVHILARYFQLIDRRPDILGQLNSTTFTLNSQGRTESWSNSIPRYLMLRCSYKFRLGAKRKQRDYYDGGDWSE